MKCFVMNPIGEPNSYDRVHIDTVLSNVIRPAMDCAEAETGTKLDLMPVQSDVKPRQVVSKIIDCIIHHDVLFAVIDGHEIGGVNPNVMYELGIAHSAGRDVIILRDASRRQSRDVFDICQHHSLSYDVKDLGSPEITDNKRKIIEAIVLQIKETKAKPAGSLRIAFDNEAIDALGSRHVRYRLITKFNGADPIENLTFNEWARFLTAADKRITIAGVSLFQLLDGSKSFVLNDGSRLSFVDILRNKAAKDHVKVRLVIMHEENRTLPEMLTNVVDNSDISQYSRVQEEIIASFSRWSQIARDVMDQIYRGAFSSTRSEGMSGSSANHEQEGSFEVIQIRRGYMNGRISLTDRGVIFTPFFMHEIKNGLGPAVIATQDTTLHNYIEAHLDFLIANNRNPPEDLTFPIRSAGA